MKERPIPFSGPMVRAILEGHKTQTRRVVKPQPKGFWADPNKCLAGGILQAIVHNEKAGNVGKVSDAYIPCPYGVPGDRLWVLEAWQYAGWTDEGVPFIRYRADGAEVLRQPSDAWAERVVWIWELLSSKENRAIDGKSADRRWQHGRFMPRWASRITLEVVSVRVERVEDISEADAIAEGFAESFDSAGGCHERTTAPENFLRTFYDLNERAPRRSNPWVWVVEFKVVSA